MSDGKPEAYVTLATTEGYAVGALVLASSLRRAGTTKRLVCMVPPASALGSSISERTRMALDNAYDDVVTVDVFDSCDAANLALLKRPDLGITFTKLNCWNLTEYSKCVFLDADTMVLQNCDDLFEREQLSAAPDPGWPDCFNSGVFVYTPSSDTYLSLLDFAMANGSFDGGDQGLLNAYFSDWATLDISRHLPFIYNVAWQTFYTYQPALRRFRSEVRVCHFLGATKPWHHSADSATGSVKPVAGWVGDKSFLQIWWDILREDVLPIINQLPSNVADLPQQFMGLQLCAPAKVSVPPLGPITPEQHQARWEQGAVDYAGIDRFENIQRIIDEKLAAENVSVDIHIAPPTPTDIPAEADLSERLPGLQPGGIAESSAEQLAGLQSRQPADIFPEQLTAQARWEQGPVDYMGIDRFDNIRMFIDKTIAKEKVPGWHQHQ